MRLITEIAVASCFILLGMQACALFGNALFDWQAELLLDTGETLSLACILILFSYSHKHPAQAEERTENEEE